VRRLDLATVGAMVAVALTLRLYRIADYTAFQGDQGTHALAVKRLLVDGVWPLEGPATSAGGAHLGPLYYYLLAVPMGLVWLEPLAAAVTMAMFGSAAVALVYVLVRLWFGTLPAIAAAGLYAISAVAITSAGSMWNPAPAPFFTLLTILGLDRFHASRHGLWLLLIGFALGAVIQLHYFAAAIVLVGFGFVVAELTRDARGQARWAAVGAVTVFTALQAPLLVHELLNGIPSLQALGIAQPSSQADSALRRAYATFVPLLIGSFLTDRSEPLSIPVALVLLGALAVAVVRPPSQWPAALVGALLVATVAMAALYRGPIFEHYLVPVSPALFLALGSVLAVAARHPTTRIAAMALTFVLAALNVRASPVLEAPQHQLSEAKAVATAIARRADGQPFALWHVSDVDSDAAYRFWLERDRISPARPAESLPHQLFVVCDQADCDLERVRASIGADWSDGRLAHQQAAGNKTVIHLVRPP